MVDEVWLHIGTPKSGTSSLQKYLFDHGDSLTSQGIAYISPEGKASANDLAVAINRDRPELADLAQNLNRQILERPEKIGVVSSEMFYGMALSQLMEHLPALRDRPINVLVYIRRQDRYIEAKYLQKSKNLRFVGSIDEFIKRFEGSGSDYWAELEDWRNLKSATLVPRIFERAQMSQGNVIADALALMGVSVEIENDTDVNVSPGYHRVQLLQAAGALGLADPRRLQRRLASQFPQKSSERSPIMNAPARREFLDRYAQGNENLRAQFFPDKEKLFDDSNLEASSQTGIAQFTDDQMMEIRRLLEVVKSFQ